MPTVSCVSVKAMGFLFLLFRISAAAAARGVPERVLFIERAK